MEYRLHPGKLLTLSGSLLNSLRQSLERYHLISLVRVLRTAVHFGPWRVVPRFLIRQFRPACNADGSTPSLFSFQDVNAIAAEIRQNSIAVAGVLPADFLRCLRAVTDRLPVDHYQLMHHIDANVRLLSEDPAIKNVLRAYFKCEPVLLESTLVVTGSHRTHGLSEQNSFHFDYAGWESLNVFVYLSDVTADSSCHVIAKGSHRSKSLSDVLYGSLTDSDALRRFGSSIHAVAGPAGTLFFENTEAFHRRRPGDQRRVMLNLLYASHRNWLSHGRASLKHIGKRARAYDRLRGLD